MNEERLSSTKKTYLPKRVKSGRSTQSKPPAQSPLKCPECGSSRKWKDGFRYVKSETGKLPIQRYLCRECGYRFSESAEGHVKSSIPTQLLKPLHSRTNHLRAFPSYNRNYRVSATEGKAKNLVKVESRLKRAAGATKLSEAEVKGTLIEYSWYMKKNGYPESTIKFRTGIIKTLINRGAPLLDPEAMKAFIAEQEVWGPGRKSNVVYAYSTFLQMEGLTWEPPRYRQPERLPFVPLESELDKLIAATSKTVSTFLQGLKETGTDPGELMRLRWIDINKEARSVTINHPVKRHNPRILPVSTELIARLEMLPKKSERVWTCLLHSMQGNFRRQRKRIVRQFANPRLHKIVFTTFRHWKATMEYHRTKDILYVMKMLGHKGLQNTLVYIDLEKAIYGVPREDEFTVRVATSLEEACDLLEAGFEYVTDMDGHKLFRKRK